MTRLVAPHLVAIVALVGAILVWPSDLSWTLYGLAAVALLFTVGFRFDLEFHDDDEERER